MFVALSALAATVGAWAQTTPYDLGIDVPTTLGSLTYSPENIVHHYGTTYSSVLALPAGTPVGALHHLADGRWLFSPTHPVTLQGSTYEPRDVVSYNGTNFAMYQQGSGLGIPSTARIDALFVDSSGNSILSFDTWVTLGGTGYGPSDLVSYNGSFSLYWSGTAMGVPLYANMVGAAVDGLGVLVVSFDVPTNLGGTDYKPGQFVKWTGSGFASYALDPQWPATTQLRDFAFPASSCANTACNDGCWANGTHPNAGTFAKHTIPMPIECEVGGGCLTLPCN
jgi:hypothetical protein